MSGDNHLPEEKLLGKIRKRYEKSMCREMEPVDFDMECTGCVVHALLRQIDRLDTQLTAELKWRRDNSND